MFESIYGILRLYSHDVEQCSVDKVYGRIHQSDCRLLHSSRHPQASFIAGAVDARKLQQIRAQNWFIVIWRLPAQNGKGVTLTLFRTTFWNSIQYYRCKTHTLTTHIWLKLLWRISRFASVMVQIRFCSIERPVCFRSYRIRWHLWAWKDLHTNIKREAEI